MTEHNIVANEDWLSTTIVAIHAIFLKLDWTVEAMIPAGLLAINSEFKGILLKSGGFCLMNWAAT